MVHREWKFAGVVTLWLLVFALHGSASSEVWATGSAQPADDPAFQGYWEYCYEIHWAGLPRGVSHIEILICPPGECGCACEPEFFAFADTSGYGGEEEETGIHYYGGFEASGDPSTGLEGMLLKFEPYEGISEPALEGSAILCFFSVAAPVFGTYPDQVQIKFGDGYALGSLDGPLPGCRQGFSPTDIKTWGYVKAMYR
jgi:hypothetical protein